MFKHIFSFLSATIFFGGVFFQPVKILAQICTPAPVGLTAWYPGNGNTFDIRGGNDGALQGGAGFAPGKVGQAFSLNGTNAFVQAPTSPGNDPTTAGSIEAWVYFNQRPSDAGHVMEIVGKGSIGQDFDLQAEPDNLFKFYVANGYNIVSSTSIQINTWYYVAATWDSTGLKMYVNGNLENSTSDPNIIRATNQLPLEIGNQPSFGPRLFNGLIDEPSIYNRALSAAEVLSIFNSAATGKCKPTSIFSPGNQVLWLAGDGDARDLSGNGNNGALLNGTNLTVGKVGQAFGFDGTNDEVSTPLINLGANYSIEFWMFPTRTSSGAIALQHLVSNDFLSAANYGALYYQFSSSTTGSLAYYQNGMQRVVTPDGGIPLNVWTHVGLTYDGSKTRLYVNGSLAATESGTHGETFNNSVKLAFSNNSVEDSAHLRGKLDETSFYNRALTAAEIASIVRADLAGKLKQITTSGTSGTVGDAIVTFSSATNRTIQEIPLDNSLFPALPMGTNTGLIYDISADVNDSSPTVCFNLPIIKPAQFSSLRIFHLENNQWQNRTASSNTYPMLCTTSLTSLSPFAIGLNSPTVANVSIGGQVMTAKGSGIANARVSLTDSNGETRSALTNGFGFYRFEEIAVGETYILSVSAKRYQFGQPMQVVSGYKDSTDNNFTALP
jgi:concanavalin A-like lectin/glucanase superfamily protein/carboxypeptidase family protein